MPRYSAVAPTFNPIDYRTRIQPLEQYKEEYDKRLDALDEQGVLADAIGGLIDENQDPELARIYKDYSNKMNTVASDLLRTGDLRSSRQSLRELRSDYANKLVPIQQAFNSRAEAGKAFRDAKIKDPSLVGNDPVNTNLGSWMNGKAPDTFTVSGDKVYAEGLADAKAQVSRVENVMKDWGLDPKLGSQYFSRLVANGYSADQVSAALAQMAGKDITDPSSLKAIQGVDEVYDYISEALNRLYSSSGVNNLENSADQREIMGRALNGILAGISYNESSEYKNYDPSFWVDAELKKIKLNEAKGDIPKKEESSYALTPFISINGKIVSKKDAYETLSWFKAGNNNLDAASSKRVEDYSMVPKDEKGNPYPYSNAYLTYKKKTYGEDLYDLAKSQGVIDKNISYNDFKNNANSENEYIANIVNQLETRIEENAQMYGEARGNVTDTKYFIKNVNDANTTFLDDKGRAEKGSLITDGKGNPVASIPDEDVEYVLPVRRHQRNGIRVKSNKDNSVYYVKPSAFYGSTVEVPLKGGKSINLSLNDAIDEYYVAIDNGRNDLAHYLRGAIMDQLAVYTRNRVKTQSSTDSKI